MADVHDFELFSLEANGSMPVAVGSVTAAVVAALLKPLAEGAEWLVRSDGGGAGLHRGLRGDGRIVFERLLAQPSKHDAVVREHEREPVGEWL